ncbi:MAG: UbiA family prenyltransferase [Microbacteriaceae bacterium]|nr:UbiA family prenyltransferase [Microbacteriaceae bacterium]
MNALGRIPLALLRSTHPWPALSVTVIAVLLGAFAGLETWRIVVLGVATALDQASVGLSNDWIDAARDRATRRRDKPVALGRVPVQLVRAVAIGCAAAALLVTVPLGWAAVGVHAIMLGAAWSYNAGLKRSAFSIVPFLVAFGLVPVLVTLSRAEPALPGWAAVGAGALLGGAAHLANALPDLDDDRRTGVLGFPHRLPRPALIALLAVLLLAGLGLLVVAGPEFLAPAG